MVLFRWILFFVYTLPPLLLFFVTVLFYPVESPLYPLTIVLLAPSLLLVIGVLLLPSLLLVIVVLLVPLFLLIFVIGPRLHYMPFIPCDYVKQL